MSRLAEVTRSALDSRPPREAILDITDEACRTLERIDPEARPRRTGQFNHSFLPDVVVDWPKAGDRSARAVYLRFDLGDELADDLEMLGNGGPMFLALSDTSSFPAQETPRRSRERLTRELSDQANALAARPDALESIASEASRDLMTQFVRSSVIEGGRGLLEKDDARLVLDSAALAYSGAQELSATDLRGPLAVLNRAFVGRITSEAIKTLHMLWWASGGSPEEFPDSTESLFDVGDDEIAHFLVYLFDHPPIEDAAFWQRLGQRISAANLLRLISAGPTVNLQRLVEQNLSRLRFKGAAADIVQARMAPLAQDHWWYVARSSLVLAGSDFELTFVDDGRHFGSRPNGFPLGVEELRRRVGQLPVDSVEVDDERRVKGIRGKERGDAGPRASSIEDLLEGEQGAVTEVRVRLPDGSRLRCSYERSTALIDEGDTSLALMARFSSSLLLHLGEARQGLFNDYVQPRQDVIRNATS